jgi:hypothetical protein
VKAIGLFGNFKYNFFDKICTFEEEVLTILCGLIVAFSSTNYEKYCDFIINILILYLELDLFYENMYVLIRYSHKFSNDINIC